MADISKIDVNFKNENANKDDMVLYDIREKPFKIYGLCDTNDGSFKRIPTEVAQKMSEGAVYLHANTSGARVRFKTNSPYIVLKASFPNETIMPHMTVAGSCGFDLYVDDEFYKPLMPPIVYDGFIPTFDLNGGYDTIASFPDKKMREITINFPLYNDVSDVYIGLQENSELLEGKNYTYEKPVVYYGSSITQGCSASRPGNNYPAVISRWLDTNFICLGFSGNARAEDSITQYISELDMSIFVYDYDHNAPTPEFLKDTHEKMFLKIRQNQPNLPIIMVSRPNEINEDADIRFNIIKETFDNAVNRGDKNVYLIDGRKIFTSIDKDMFTVDGCHPTDLGFYCMAKEIGNVMKKILK